MDMLVSFIKSYNLINVSACMCMYVVPDKVYTWYTSSSAVPVILPLISKPVLPLTSSTVIGSVTSSSLPSPSEMVNVNWNDSWYGCL